MIELLIVGLSLLWAPSRSWRRLGGVRCDSTSLVGYVVTLAVIPLMFRLAGHFLDARFSNGSSSGLDSSFSIGASAAEAILFVVIMLGAASGSGVLIAAATRKMGSEISDFVSQQLVLLSSTPVFVLGLFYGIPSPKWVWPHVLLFSLGWGALLLFRGLAVMTNLDARGIIVVALTGACAWILTATILSQVLVLVLASG